MKFYKIANEIVASATALNAGEELVPNTTDAAGEKHVPVVAIDGDKVTVSVGSVEHPMLPAHYIQWILIETETGWQKRTLTPDDKPCATFIVDAKVVAAYEYCNLHGLWKNEQ